jgi:prepilin-type N-terminal cleavage/methylation domain-containing protein
MTDLMARYRARKAGDESEIGFTLIELLIVIVVLGVLAAVTVFALGGVTSKSAVSACNTDAATVNTAISAYDASTGYITGTVNTAAGVTPVIDAPTSALLVSDKYLQAFPSNASHYIISIGTATSTTPGKAVPLDAGVVLVQAPASVAVGSAAIWTPASTTSATGACAKAS